MPGAPGRTSLLAPHTSGRYPSSMDGRPHVAPLRSGWIGTGPKVAQFEREFAEYDAAHAIEALDRGRKVGTIGDVACFSFYVTKNLVTGEGGMVTTNREELARRIKVQALHGLSADAWQRYSDAGFKHYEVTHAPT